MWCCALSPLRGHSPSAALTPVRLCLTLQPCGCPWDGRGVTRAWTPQDPWGPAGRSGCRNTIPQTGRLKHWALASHGSGGWKPMTRVPANRAPGEARLCWPAGTIASLSSRGLSSGLALRGGNPDVSVTSSDPSPVGSGPLTQPYHPPRFLFPDTVAGGWAPVRNRGHRGARPGRPGYFENKWLFSVSSRIITDGNLETVLVSEPRFLPWRRPRSPPLLKNKRSSGGWGSAWLTQAPTQSGLFATPLMRFREGRGLRDLETRRGEEGRLCAGRRRKPTV